MKHLLPLLPKCLLLVTIISTFGINLQAQEKTKYDFRNFRHNYFSIAYVEATGMEKLTLDPFYKRDFTFDKTFKVALGAQFSKSMALEIDYTRNSIWLKKKLVVNDQKIKSGGRTDASISFTSIKLVHNLPLYKDKFLFTTRLGYALGKSNVPQNDRGPGNPITFESNNVSYTETSTIKGLRSGTNHFVAMGLGLEYLLLNRFSIFSNVSYYKGFRDLQEEIIDYNVDGQEGSVTITNDGSILGLEVGIKYKFNTSILRTTSRKLGFDI